MKMEPKAKLKIKSIILEQIANLESIIPQLQAGAKPVEPDVSLGRITRMEAINEKSVKEANLNKSKRRLVLLQKTLLKLDDDNFGICARCGEEIPFKRLAIMPESIVCMDCLQNRD